MLKICRFSVVTTPKNIVLIMIKRNKVVGCFSLLYFVLLYIQVTQNTTLFHKLLYPLLGSSQNNVLACVLACLLEGSWQSNQLLAVFFTICLIFLISHVFFHFYPVRKILFFMSACLILVWGIKKTKCKHEIWWTPCETADCLQTFREYRCYSVTWECHFFFNKVK